MNKKRSCGDSYPLQPVITLMVHQVIILLDVGMYCYKQLQKAETLAHS